MSRPADGPEIVWGLVRASWRFAALHAMIDLGCAEHLAGGPLTVTELAGRCGAHAPSLERVLRTLAGAGLVATVAPHTYALTDAGAVLRTPTSARLAVEFTAEPACWEAMGALPEAVRTGRATFTERFGPLYDYLADRPETRRLFDDFMVSRSAPLAARVAEVHDFSGVRTVVDVGGGNGAFLAAILRAHAHLRGVLLERETALPAARELLGAPGLGGRCELVAGDFFTGVPGGAEVHLLASVVHNWDDADAVRLLRTVRAAMRGDGRLLLVDLILPDDDRPHYGKDLDVRMLSLFGEGRERSRADYFTLLCAAGLQVDRVSELPGGFSLVEASPAG